LLLAATTTAALPKQPAAGADSGQRLDPVDRGGSGLYQTQRRTFWRNESTTGKRIVTRRTNAAEDAERQWRSQVKGQKKCVGIERVSRRLLVTEIRSSEVRQSNILRDRWFRALMAVCCAICWRKRQAQQDEQKNNSHFLACPFYTEIKKTFENRGIAPT